jgi:hypothetical protein
MSLLATLALAASTSAGATLPQCSWDKPGVNPFMGDVVAAVDRYQDIPQATRDKLKARMRARNYDDIAVIDRDAIKGKASYDAAIRDMHFGQGSICRTVTRTKWTATMQERGLVYCEDGHCILVPTVCRNVSRIGRKEAPRAVAPAQAANVASSTRETAPEAPLEFEAPSAGPLAAAAPASFASESGVPSLSLPSGTSPNPVVAGGGGGLPSVIDLGRTPLPPGRVTRTDSELSLPGEVPAIPEPSSWLLLAGGLALLAYRRSNLAK